jgi:hypothetical protein
MTHLIPECEPDLPKPVSDSLALGARCGLVQRSGLPLLDRPAGVREAAAELVCKSPNRGRYCRHALRSMRLGLLNMKRERPGPSGRLQTL